MRSRFPLFDLVTAVLVIELSACNTVNNSRMSGDRGIDSFITVTSDADLEPEVKTSASNGCGPNGTPMPIDFKIQSLKVTGTGCSMPSPQGTIYTVQTITIVDSSPKLTPEQQQPLTLTTKTDIAEVFQYIATDHNLHDALQIDLGFARYQFESVGNSTQVNSRITYGNDLPLKKVIRGCSFPLILCHER